MKVKTLIWRLYACGDIDVLVFAEGKTYPIQEINLVENSYIEITCGWEPMKEGDMP